MTRAETTKRRQLRAYRVPELRTPSGGHYYLSVEGRKRYKIVLEDDFFFYGGGVVNDLVRYVFTHGCCGILARAIHRRAEWPIVRAGWVGNHFAVQVPDGRILDIEGAHSSENWQARWGEILPARPEEIDRASMETGARTFVTPLLREAR
jgi:hypothetical protein